MAKTYKPAVFQPTVRPDWGGVLSYIPDAEKSEILIALFKYPSVECSSRFWLETIKPELDSQFEEFKRQCELKSRGIRERWGKTSITPLQDNYNTTNTQVIVSKRESKEEDKSKSIDENTIFQAGGQMWVMPTQFRNLAKKYWLEEEIRKIEQEHSCHENLVELSINELLASNPPKPKKKTYGEQGKVKLTDEEYEKLQELYGQRLDIAIQKLDSYIASYNKKYASHYAVMRKGNWVYTETFKQEFIPPTPEIADKSTFVRAKPL